MLKKFTNKKGFTLMEMLIVVAIIAVLVAIAIPTFNSALTRAKEGADVANIRAAYANCQIDMLTNGAKAPADKTEFVGKVEAKLNFENKLDYSVDTSGNATIKDLLTKWRADPFCGKIVIGGMQHDGTPKQTNGNAFRRYRVTDSRNPPAAEDRADGIL